MKILAKTVFYSHLCFMVVIFFGKAFTPLGLVDILIISTTLLQVIFVVCPITILEEWMYKKSKLPYSYKSWTKRLYRHFGFYGHFLSFAVMWSVSEITYMAFSKILNIEYQNFLVEHFVSLSYDLVSVFQVHFL